MKPLSRYVTGRRVRFVGLKWRKYLEVDVPRIIFGNARSAGGYPVVKLLFIIMERLSGPIASGARNAAMENPFFRKYICLPIAVVYMWSERVVDRLSRGGPPKEVPPYVEKKAVRLGANLIGEFVIFGTAAAFITLEFLRQKRKRQIKQQEEMLGKQALRQQAREAQYNRDRRTSELEDLKKQMEVLQQRLLAPETQKKMKNVEGEPDAASGIRIEDKYLASGVALRAQGGADEGQLERAAAKAASKIARAYGKDTQTVKKEAAAAALQKSKELKKAKEVKEAQDLNVLDSAVTAVKDLGSVTAAELPKKTEQLNTMKKDQMRAEAVATQIIQQEDMEKKSVKENNSKLPKVEEMTDKEAEEVSEKAAEEAAKVALEKLDPDTGKLKQVTKQVTEKKVTSLETPRKTLLPWGNSPQRVVEWGAPETENPPNAERHAKTKSATRRGSSLLPSSACMSMGRLKSGFAWTALCYFLSNALRLSQSTSVLATKSSSYAFSFPAPAYDTIPDTTPDTAPGPLFDSSAFTATAPENTHATYHSFPEALD